MTLEEREEIMTRPAPQDKVKKKDQATPKAEFFEDGTEEEFKEYTHLETHGWKGFINKIKNL